MKLLKKIIAGMWFFFWGHILGFLFYDSKYLKGRWFEGRFHGLCSTGWKWVVQDSVARILLRHNVEARFPVSSQMRVGFPNNIHFDPDDLNNFQSLGVYIQAIGDVWIGKGTYIGPNVGIITSNHNMSNLDEHLAPKSVRLGEKCWIGMNSVLLPGVELGGGYYCRSR